MRDTKGGDGLRDDTRREEWNKIGAEENEGGCEEQ